MPLFAYDHSERCPRAAPYESASRPWATITVDRDLHQHELQCYSVITLCHNLL